MLRPFAYLPFTHRLVDHFPGDPEKENFTRKVQNILYSEVRPTPVKEPKLVGWSSRLAEELGISKPDENDRESLSILAGNSLAEGMKPYASRYGGHQFGNWAGQLGDGRAITLGEAATLAGPEEFQLKGAGPTPYSRRADGRAVLRSSIREFLCSEAMHFLGVPTTRALSLVETGELVTRDFFYDGNPKDEPGAIVCRVSPSFLRFGNFEILASHGEEALFRQLADYLIETHYPNFSYTELLFEISRRTAVLMAEWMRVGFVHGVMNTDNMSVLGLTLDYGPYGWLEPFEPNWTPNTTDAERRRYSFGNQAGIGLWNVARLAESFGVLIPDQSVLEQSLEIYRETFGKTNASFLASKLGFKQLNSEDQTLIEALFMLLKESRADYTLFFRALSGASRGSDFLSQVKGSFYDESLSEPLEKQWMEFFKDYDARLQAEAWPDSERLNAMKAVNPKYVLRNYLAQTAIIEAEKGDYRFMERLLRVLEHPYDEQESETDLASKRPDWAEHSPGSSSLSCSS